MVELDKLNDMMVPFFEGLSPQKKNILMVHF